MKLCGFFISKLYNFLVVFLDGLVYNVDFIELSFSGFIEINFVFLKENEILYDGFIRKRIFFFGLIDG